MTRINLIAPKELSDQHLLAEIRELPRIFKLVEKYGIQKSKIPNEFTLGKGHVNFFRDKLFFLLNRYNQLYIEAKSRDFKINYKTIDLYIRYKSLILNSISYNLWIPNYEDIQKSKNRIDEKIQNKPNFYRWRKQ